MKNGIVPLKASELRWTCPLSSLPFKTTRELQPLKRIVGQDRAVEALRLGARIRSQGYNIWASGVVGTGRMTTIRQILDEMKQSKPELFDFAFVHNFRQTDTPVLLRFQAGEGRVFRRMVEDALAVLGRRIPQLFEEEQFQVQRKEIIQRYQSREQALLKELDAKLRPEGFVLGQIQEDDGTARTEIFPLIDEKPRTLDDLDEMLQKGEIKLGQVEKIRDAYLKHKEELNEIGSRSLRIMAEFRNELSRHDRNAVGVLVKTVFHDVRVSFPRDRVAQFLDDVANHIISHLEEFVRINSARLGGVTDEALEEHARALERLYTVNLIIDNYDTKEAPVIIETSPTHATLFGTIEKRIDAKGFAVTDFTQIRAGSLLRANGGFIALNAMDVLTDPVIWSALKKVLLYGRLEIQTPESQFQLNTVKPEYISVNVKIILLGDPSIYHALWAAEEDFHKMFKIHAEFDEETDRSQIMITHMSSFFAQMAEEEDLLHCDKTGAAGLIEWAVAYTDSQEKITLQFSYVADLMREASHYAHQAGANLISRTHVKQALDERLWRSNSVDERLREQITKGVLLIDVEGKRVGQINGLTVYQSGIVSYGKPSRITATVSAGNAGLINIEREVKLSGAIHNKGVMILSGLLRSLFSRSQPISFTASIAFEQSYGGIDGDSASVAEIVALLSAISNIAVRQDLAVTGSINQKGDIQAIGGVNEKIIGFFEVCKDKGLTGTQGVLIPHTNIKDLMLRDDVIDAVRKKNFSIYPIRRLEEAVSLLLGTPAGKLQPNGMFPEKTVYAKVQHNLNVLHEASKMKG
ncbi:MAG: AAA family ATPase [Ignavibacteria bacterium]|nr:AAA family ATPase [Ignavibacteria bacterium]